MDAYFNIDSLEKRFGAFRLGPVSLNLEEKDYLVLLGTTGCGKTSLLRSIVGIRGKIKDSIFLDGRDIGIGLPFESAEDRCNLDAGFLDDLLQFVEAFADKVSASRPAHLACGCAYVLRFLEYLAGVIAKAQHYAKIKRLHKHLPFCF